MALVVRDLGRCPYPEALALQEELVERKLSGDPDDYLLFVEHDPTYTLGRGADAADLQGADARLMISAYRTGRGGGVTFHGPGQLVAYPIFALKGVDRDVRAYVRRLEKVLIDCCAAFGLLAYRREGAPGAWVDGAKIASIGIAMRRWVTFHGIALNVATDLSYFDAIVPCRDPAMRLTSLAQLISPTPAMGSVHSVLLSCFSRCFGQHPQAADENPSESW